MGDNLDLKREEYSALLERVKELLLAQYEKVDHLKGYHNHSQKEVESWFDERLPMKGITEDELFNIIQKRVVDPATGNLGPHMYAYVMSGGNQISAAAQLIVNTINQNVGKWHLSPSMSEIEKRVVNWAGEIINYSDHPGGVTVSGGSAANLAGLTVARNIFFENEEIRKKGVFNLQPFTIYASDEVHSCVDKSTDILGIGTNQLRKISTNAKYQINIEILESRIQEDIANNYKPFCIVGTAGTVNTGAIDDLNALADIAQKYNMWFHVDGAYGGLASALEHLRADYTGIERADSVALDFHKWLYQPFEAGCILVKNWDDLRRSYFKKAAYLDTSLEEANRLSFNEHHFQLSRDTKAFKVWMSLKYYGFDRFRQMIQKDIDLTAYLVELINQAPDFEFSATSKLAVACFRYTGDLNDENEITALNKKLIPALENDGRVFITGTTLRGKYALRACLINHRKTKESTEYLLDVIRDVGSRIS